LAVLLTFFFRKGKHFSPGGAVSFLKQHEWEKNKTTKRGGGGGGGAGGRFSGTWGGGKRAGGKKKHKQTQTSQGPNFSLAPFDGIFVLDLGGRKTILDFYSPEQRGGPPRRGWAFFLGGKNRFQS